MHSNGLLMHAMHACIYVHNGARIHIVYVRTQHKRESCMLKARLLRLSGFLYMQCQFFPPLALQLGKGVSLAVNNISPHNLGVRIAGRSMVGSSQ